MGTGQRNRQIETSNIAQGIHIVAKPTGPACNLNCAYCFYLEKKALFGVGSKYRMTDEILSVFIKKYIQSQPTPLVEFVWQGGEPTLLGMDFFKRVVELQRPFARRKMIRNSLQTNGTLLTRKWCEFLKKYNFMVGISLDGPKEIHDRYRRDRRGNGTFDRVMQGLKLLQKYRIEYNVMACVARDTAKQPLDIYRFFRSEGVEFIQFTPVVERMPDESSLSCGLRLAGPASLDKQERQTQVTPWTVLPEEYGDFLIEVYEEWIRHDVGKVFIMNFEWALNTWIGNPSSVCIHAEQCGRSVVLEHNGDVYACDHCVYPEYKLGNIATDSLSDLVAKSMRSGFGIIKDHALPRQCKACEVLAACRGGCPKHRFDRAYDDEPGLQYLCEGYKKFFLHIRKYLNVITQLLEKGLPASLAMEALKAPLVIKLRQPESSKPTKNKRVLHWTGK